MKAALSVLCIVLLVSVLEAAVTKPISGNFIQCLCYRTSPENPITGAIFTADNTTTFLSSYLSYTKNKRFSSPDYTTLLAIVAGLEKIWKTMLKFNFVWIELNPYGGVMDRIPATAHATETKLTMMKELYDVAEPYVSSNPREAFFNFRDIDIGSNPSGETNLDEAKIYGYKYFLGNLKRLMDVKAKYDHENFFKNEQSIAPVRVLS